ncbi:unnamed protein product [Rotaria socialis]|uniref:G-protein coupled receptors family 1 profile domain-containing protein n=1 Tax=Rotaria socialis TaxID=392032 RepID=A0A818WZY8_9BILA|nr:unnamed protein product [Rotaria socialis]CAF4668388.1 unnamed protein product [Rotaria socialis]
MFNASHNPSLNEDLKNVATIFTIVTILLALLTILLDLSILARLICHGKLRKCMSRSKSRRVGLLHSTNTYIHVIGCTTTFLLISIRTLFGDFYTDNKFESVPSRHCRLLNCLMSMFSAGIYGSCFLHALFRFWRTVKSKQRLLRQFTYNIRLIIVHWIIIMILSIPVWFRSVYLSSENYCFNRFSDTWSSVYISITFVAIPVSGIFIVYMEIVFYMKQHWQSRERLRRMKRDVITIKRIILLAIVLLATSSAAIILWLLMFVQKRMHRLSYRLLCFMAVVGLLTCSVTLLSVSPQLRRAIKLTAHRRKREHSNNDSVGSPSEMNVVDSIPLNYVFNF